MLPGKAERALRYEFICKMGGPPEFRYCNGEWAKHVESVSRAPLAHVLSCMPLYAPASSAAARSRQA